MIRHPLFAVTQLILSVWLAAWGLVRAPQEQLERAPLSYGVPVRARLNRAGAHRYPLPLTIGQYVQVEAKALSGDISMELTAADGRPLMKINPVNGLPEGKTVAAVAEETADYFVRIRARDLQRDGIDYEVRVSELRPATGADRARCRGEQLFAAGEELYDQRTKDSYLAALEKYRAAVPYYEQAEDWFGLAQTIETMGEAYYQLANYQESLSAFERALPFVRKAERTLKALTLEAQITSNIGAIADAQYDKQKALYHFLQAAAAYRQLNNRLSEAVCLMNIGNIYTVTGQPDDAWSWYGRALSIYRELGSKQQEALVLNSQGAAKFFQGEYRLAISEQQAGLELWRQLNNGGKQGWTLTNIAANHLALREPQLALTLLNEAVPLIKKGGNQRDEAYALHCLGDAYRLLGQPDQALTYYQGALDLRRPLNEKILDAFSIMRMAQTESQRGRLDEALAQSDRALTLVEQVRQRYSNPMLGATFSASTHHYYAEHIALLLKLREREPAADYEVRAFQTSERAHARALLESLSDLGRNPRAEVPAALIEREAVLQRSIDRVVSDRSQAARTTDPAARSTRLRELENELRQLTTEADELQGQIRASSPRYAALLRPQPLSPAEIQRQLLTPDSLLLEYFVAQDRLYLFALTGERDRALRVVEIPDRALIEKAAGFFQRKKFETGEELRRRFSYQNPEFARTVRFLSEKLLAPVKPLLQKRKIWIVSDSSLQRIPFAALPDPRPAAAARTAARRSPIRPLIVEHELAMLPSASTVAWFRQVLATRQPATGGVAVLADPVFSARDGRVKAASSSAAITRQSTGDPDLDRAWQGFGEPGALNRLPASRDEALAIAQVAPEGSLVALDFDANRELVMSGRLSNYRYLHFATHAYVDDLFPGLSWLALSQVDRRGQPQPGYLRLNDIYQLRLNADLVVLGACRTGLGKQVRGEGLISLSRGFIYAGAPRVVVSLWEVPDLETSLLMQSFYRNLLAQRLPAAEALRLAQIEMWKRAESNAPFFWAAFSLQGDPEK
ncbi:MAG TPA: CHAT domain-containing tetratricopeptide repeat protein [Blastocatellia bacterium]|nr:CHAT domain-containing tetratricopeptide repeat protein [Blastocatellia bacterium]